VGFFDMLTWAEASEINRKIDIENRERVEREEANRKKVLKDSVKKLYQELYTQMKLSKVDLSQVDALKREYNSSFNDTSRRNSRYAQVEVGKLLYGIFLGSIAIFALTLLTNAWLQDREFKFLRVVFMALFAYMLSRGYANIKEFLVSIKRNRLSPSIIKKDRERLLEILKGYPMLSAYGLYLKTSLDYDVAPVYQILSVENSVRADKAKELLYKCFDMPENTPIEPCKENNIVFMKV